jgi:hypothetical protein
MLVVCQRRSNCFFKRSFTFLHITKQCIPNGCNDWSGIWRGDRCKLYMQINVPPVPMPILRDRNNYNDTTTVLNFPWQCCQLFVNLSHWYSIDESANNILLPSLSNRPLTLSQLWGSHTWPHSYIVCHIPHRSTTPTHKGSVRTCKYMYINFSAWKAANMGQRQSCTSSIHARTYMKVQA